MTVRENFLQANKEAQDIVKSIEDPALRIAAYQIVLPRLLDRPQPSRPYLDGKDTPGGNVSSKGRKSETKDRILELRESGFFLEPKSPTEVRQRLRTDGYHHNPADVRMALLRLAQKKALRRLEDGTRGFRYAQI